MLPALIAINLNTVPPDLDAFLKKRDPSVRYEIEAPTANGPTKIQLTSGVWQGTTWKHTVLFLQPPKVAHKGVGILYITGDGPTQGDLGTLALTAAGTGMPVAMLFGVPNQPLWGMKEDDLIAHTFEKFLETGDSSWPLLFPMTRSALKAMDAVQAVTKGTDNPLNKFVVCGASKRGWTTWLVGAARDKRVIGIAPMVIDNLNLMAQMRHQIETWGEYSAQIQDYTNRGLQAKMTSERGKKLVAMVDPYTYRDRIKVPTLIIKGSNDPYWTVDALDQYEPALKMPHWILNVPNAGHTLNGGLQAAESIGAFARALAGEFTLPKVDWKIEPYEGRQITVQVNSTKLATATIKVWRAESDTLDFRNSKYTVVANTNVSGNSGKESRTAIRALLAEGKNCAVFAEARYRVKGREFSISSPTKVFRK